MCSSLDDQFTVRVTNLSEEAQEGDLKELFSHFGQLKRTFLAKDKITQQSKVGGGGCGGVIYFIFHIHVGICFCQFYLSG